MSLIDCAIIGRLGADSLAATGASISIFSLAGLLVSFLSYVTVPAVAEAAAQGDKAEVSKVISTGVWIAVVAGIMVTGFIIAVGPVILNSMMLEAAVVEKAGGYVWARALGSIGYLLVLVGSGSFRGMQVSYRIHLRCTIHHISILGYGRTLYCLAGCCTALHGIALH